MRKGRFIAVAGMLCAACLSPLFADEASERRLAEEALSAGDYKSAAKFFENARLLAGDDAERWSADTLAMADAKLRDGDLDGARKLLAEYRSRFPARSAGILPGEILMAEKRYGEAEAFFAGFAAEASEPGAACAAEFGVGEARLQQKNYKGAIEKFLQIENENADLPQWVRRAHEARIFALLESGDLPGADALLRSGKFRKEDADYWRCLELLSLLLGKKFDPFYAGWNELRKKDWKNPPPILGRLAADGARLAMEGKHAEAAIRLWADTFELAETDSERQNALRERINLQSGSDPEQAAETIRRYLSFFPDSPDRTGILMRGAQLLARAGKPEGAIELYSRITGDKRLPANDRLTAAREAAVAASNGGMFPVAEQMFRYLVEQAETPSQKLEGEFLLGKHFFQRGDFAHAAEFMKPVADSGGADADLARYWLLRSLISLERYAEAAPVAEKLRDAHDETLRVSADYFRAFLLEKRGQNAAARSEYERFLVLHPDSEFVPEAMLSSAELALALRDFPAAADGFFRYADRKPAPQDAQRALYLAMQSACFYGNRDEVDKALKLLDSRFPNSTAGVEARLQLADSLASEGDNNAAEAQLAELEKRGAAKNPEVAAEILYRRAQISVSTKNMIQAMERLKALLERFSSSSFAADSAMLAGNLEADSGHYAEALAFYTKARELRPKGVFGLVAAGRIADTRYSIYAGTHDPADLKAAAELYEMLSKEASNPRLQLQSICKLGKCRELSGELEKALELYNRVLYLAIDQKRNGLVPDPVWTGKAGYAAALAYLKTGTPVGARNALRVTWILEELQLETGEDFERIRQEIQQKYHLQRKR